MWSRLIVLASLVFWMVMSFLLWRVEYGEAQLSGVQVNPNRIWKKVLTSPDSSSLVILHQGRRVGFCHLITSVADQLNQFKADDLVEGMVSAIGGYRLDLSGSAVSEDGELRTRFDSQLLLSPDRHWSAFRVRLVIRPVTLEISAKASDQLVRVQMESPDGIVHRVYRIADLASPEYLLSNMLGPAGPMLSTLAPVPLGHQTLVSLSNGVKWKARTDIMTIGQTVTHVYELRARVLDRYDLVLIVSRAGEILKAELPGGTVLVNEAMTTL